MLAAAGSCRLIAMAYWSFTKSSSPWRVISNSLTKQTSPWFGASGLVGKHCMCVHVCQWGHGYSHAWTHSSPPPPPLPPPPLLLHSSTTPPLITSHWCEVWVNRSWTHLTQVGQTSLANWHPVPTSIDCGHANQTCQRLEQHVQEDWGSKKFTKEADVWTTLQVWLPSEWLNGESTTSHTEPLVN